MRWWRAYDDALHDPKVQELPDALFKRWFNLLCVASKHGGQLPVISELTFLLRGRCDHVQRDLNELLKRRLLDEKDGVLSPHNWLKYQYKSDNSTPRVKAHRDAKRNVSVTTPDNRVQNTDTEQKDSSLRSLCGRDATRTDGCDDKFQQFKQSYPKRDGANPWQPARKKFIAALKSGTEADAIIAGARKYAAECQRLQHVGTPMVAMAVTWLNQQRWTDFFQESDSRQRDYEINGVGWRPGLPTNEELRKKYANRNPKSSDSGVVQDGGGPRKVE